MGQRSYTQEGVNFAQNAVIEGKTLQGFFFPSFSWNKLLCSVEALQEYKRKLKSLRGKEMLFLAMIKHHRPVTSSTIARWLKKVLELSEIDTSIYSVHSAQGASTSAASANSRDLNRLTGLLNQCLRHKPVHDPCGIRDEITWHRICPQAGIHMWCGSRWITELKLHLLPHV